MPLSVNPGNKLSTVPIFSAATPDYRPREPRPDQVETLREVLSYNEGHVGEAAEIGSSIIHSEFRIDG